MKQAYSGLILNTDIEDGQDSRARRHNMTDENVLYTYSLFGMVSGID